jgi:NADH-quinone oxidoreductase subunit G
MSGTEELVTLTIDGVEVQVPKGTLIIRAAEQLGTIVPRFCDHPLLDPVGACRQCVVEVEGQPKPVMSCTVAVAPDMVVRTHLTSEVAKRGQEGTLEFLLVNHPLDCPMCDKGGECPAAGPGARARCEHVALPRPEAQVRQAGRRQPAGAARP